MSRNDTVDRLRGEFLARSSALRGNEPGWLSLLRHNALERFLDRGFPAARDEAWRFTNVSPIAKGSFALTVPGNDAGAAALKERSGLGELSCHELVFLNGRLSTRSTMSTPSGPGTLPDGVVLTSLADVLSSGSTFVDDLQPVLSANGKEETPFFDLNEAFFSDGAFVYVPRGVVMEQPIHLLFLNAPAEPSVMHPRNVILAEPGSQVRIIETYVGDEKIGYWTNVVTQVIAGGGAVVDHYKLQREGAAAFHVSSLGYVQASSSSVSDHSLSLGSRLARHDIRTELVGEGADVTLNGLYLAKRSQHVDHHTVIDHRAARCTSRELYKGILDDEASGVFNGRVIVREHAQKTDARQSNKNLLLSDKALVNTNPQLEINADDVKCAHGATIGQLDAEALFYLRSRGIGQPEARRILTEGFMADVSNRIRVPAIRDTLRDVLFPKAA